MNWNNLYQKIINYFNLEYDELNRIKNKYIWIGSFFRYEKASAKKYLGLYNFIIKNFRKIKFDYSHSIVPGGLEVMS